MRFLLKQSHKRLERVPTLIPCQFHIQCEPIGDPPEVAPLLAGTIINLHRKGCCILSNAFFSPRYFKDRLRKKQYIFIEGHDHETQYAILGECRWGRQLSTKYSKSKHSYEIGIQTTSIPSSEKEQLLSSAFNTDTHIHS